MPSAPEILAFAGSARRESFNKKLIKVAAKSAEQAGASVTVLDLADLPMPLFDEDLEAAQGLPDNVKQFKTLLASHAGLMIASPEYNGSISPLLKNALDWASRAETADEPPLSAYRNKTSCIMSASPGGLGGLRGLVILRLLLSNLGVNVLASQRAVPAAGKAFAGSGELLDDTQRTGIDTMVGELVELLLKQQE